MKRALVLLFIMLIASVAAVGLKDAKYLIVVGKDAPASDVVLGANFAASMKGSLGVTFASAIDEDAYAQLSDDDIAKMTIVVIDGQDKLVKVMGTSDAAAAADMYFTQQGFKTKEVSYPKRADLLLHPLVPVVKEAIENATDAAVNTTNTIINTTRNVQQTVTAVVEKVENATSEKTNASAPQHVEPPKQNIIQKIFSWIAHLF